MKHSGVTRVFGLDVLRAVAILSVMALHSTDLLVFTGISGNFADWLELQTSVLGVYGVEIFFVLSGFLIGAILLSLAPSFKNPRVLPAFWQRRWLRTLPNYFLFLGINIAILRFLSPSTLPNMLPYFLFLQNWLWIQPRFFLVSWSLAVEEWFYLLFPIAIFAFHRRLTYEKAFVVSALVFLVIPTILRIIWAFSGHTDWDEEFRKVTLLRLDAIMYGVLASQIKTVFPDFWEKFKYILLVAGLGILFGVWLYFVEVGFNDWIAKTLLFSAISLGASFLLPFCDQWQISKENLVTRIFRQTALWSYSLYLCHLSVGLIIKLSFLLLDRRTIPLSIAAWLAFYALSFALAAFLYRYFEKPIMNLRERFPILLEK